MRPKGRTYQSRAYILGDKGFRLSTNHRAGFDNTYMSHDHFWVDFQFGGSFADERPHISVSRAYILGDKHFRLSANHRAGFNKRGHVIILGSIFNLEAHLRAKSRTYQSRGPIF